MAYINGKKVLTTYINGNAIADSSIVVNVTPETPTLTDLRGTTWLLNKTLVDMPEDESYSILLATAEGGITLPTNLGTIRLRDDSSEYSGLYTYNSKYFSQSVAYYRTDTSSNTPNTLDGTGGYVVIVTSLFGSLTTYSADDEASRLVYIQSGDDTTNTDLISWFTKNATLIS